MTTLLMEGSLIIPPPPQLLSGVLPSSTRDGIAVEEGSNSGEREAAAGSSGTTGEGVSQCQRVLQWFFPNCYLGLGKGKS